MPNYRESDALYTENLGVKILEKLGIVAIKNNTKDIHAVDLITEINHIRIDVQYSQDFKRWGDLRLDFVSAYLRWKQQKRSC
ncbi:hypothetical protein NHP21005_10570 [Helicobacter sp. NHP21005]|nr:hypothetical protein NHP21005_10570 [Helicobacter sp. NHP21005]